MKFEKPALRLEEQADLLLQRGMQGDRDFILQCLASVNYYRLSGYWHPFKQQDDSFTPGADFQVVWQRYLFDRELRLLLMDAIERIEIMLRMQIAYHHAHTHGPFAYITDRSSRPKLTAKEFPEFYTHLLEELSRNKEPFIKHFYSKYGDCHDAPPIWEAAEVMSFGSLVTFYKGTTHSVKKSVASVLGIPDTVMESWLLALNTVRNICAHHSRMWNRELGNKPKIPQKDNYPDWHIPVQIPNDRVFSILTICQYSLNRIAPECRWADRLRRLLTEYPAIPLASMGFPTDWEKCPIWKHNPPQQGADHDS